MDILNTAKPTIDHDRCTRCRTCVEICPGRYLSIKDNMVVGAQHLFMGCIGCGHCMMCCPEDCIKVEGLQINPSDLAQFPDGKKPAGIDEFDALLLKRRSVRVFKEQSVEDEKIKRILDAVATAPMGIPPSPIGVTVINGKEKVAEFCADAIESFEKMTRFLDSPMRLMLRFMMGKADYELINVFVRPLLHYLAEEWHKGNDYFTFSAPLAFLFHTRPGSDVVDASIATTYAMLAAEALGLGSCWIGSVVALNRNLELKRRYKVPEKNRVVSLLVCGYSAQSFQRSIRRELAAVEWI